MQIVEKFRDEYSFLSNFYPAKIELDGKIWESSEHLYQAMKCTSAQDIEEVRKHPFKGLKTFANSKIIRSDWNDVKENVMYAALYGKFSQNPNLKYRLLALDGFTIIEGNDWHDNYWGDCSCDSCYNIRGQNKLGVMLEDLIKEFKRENK